ncbi:hypothetical protein ACQ4PT_040571 [Festuca glaucescens]
MKGCCKSSSIIVREAYVCTCKVAAPVLAPSARRLAAYGGGLGQTGGGEKTECSRSDAGEELLVVGGRGGERELGRKGSILYSGECAGSACLDAAGQPATSCSLLHLWARLHALELAGHAGAILVDAAHWHLELNASMEIAVLLWSRRYSVRIERYIVADPVFLKVVEQMHEVRGGRK